MAERKSDPEETVRAIIQYFSVVILRMFVPMPKKLRKALTATYGRGERSLIAAATKGGSPAVFSATVGLLDEEVRLDPTPSSWCALSAEYELVPLRLAIYSRPKCFCCTTLLFSGHEKSPSSFHGRH